MNTLVHKTFIWQLRIKYLRCRKMILRAFKYIGPSFPFIWQLRNNVFTILGNHFTTCVHRSLKHLLATKNIRFTFLKGFPTTFIQLVLKTFIWQKNKRFTLLK